MSRSRRKDLGLSTREYEEAIILERIFNLTKRNRCSTCLVRKSSHVDPDRYKLLCSSCASRCPFKIHIGSDHLPMSVLEQLESIYGKHKPQKLPASSKNQGRKTAGHRYHHHRSHSTSSSSNSVEIHKPSHHHRRPTRLDSASSDEDDHHRSSVRYKSHGPRRSVSSGSSFDGRRSKTYEEFKSTAPKPSSHRHHHPLDDHRPRRDNYDRVTSDYHVSPPLHGNAEHNHPVYPGRPGKSYPRKDPYGYEIPVADDMPGMVGIMARDQTVAPRRTHRHVENGWPVVDPTADKESENRMNRHRDRYLPATNDRLNVRPDNFVEDRPVMRTNAISSSTRESRSNPFARKDAVYKPDIMNRNRGSDHDVDRFNMSSMRLALQPQLGSQAYGIDDAFPAFEPPMRNGRRYVADYGGLYNGRGTR